MRTKQEMFDLILNTAKSDERIRGVLLNGSRANPNLHEDIFMDYDIVYIVTNIPSFTCDHSWIDIFGERIMVQLPDDWHNHPYDYGSNDAFAYLILLMDGNRIDLTLVSAQDTQRLEESDSLTLILLDKDGVLPSYPPPSEDSFLVKPPTQWEFTDCCNEFFWCIQNVAKAIWRDQFPNAMKHLEICREMLNYMVSWWIGKEHDFAVSTGKMGKYFKKYLPHEYWKLYEKTYTDSQVEHIWQAVFASCSLFRSLGQKLAGDFNYPYPLQDDERMIEYLKKAQQLPLHN